jgi:AAHS family 4-hydroxybenzoate transporter-like MFS transporter
MKVVDVGPLLDEGPWTGYQKLLIAATALTIVLDGVDNQLLSVAIPALMTEWSLPRAAFTHVVAIGLVGMMIGGAIAGILGDRLGRRVALLGCVFTFGLLTSAIVFVDDIWTLAALRFLSGLGLGGAMPNATALASEYVPRRFRPFAVTLTVVCIPFGGFVAGVVGARVLPELGWRMLFGIGGVLPLFLGLALIKFLPESPRFLARHRERWGDLTRLLRRLGHDIPADPVYTDPAEAASSTSIRELFVPQFRRDTLALCGSFFFCLLAAYGGVFWLPSMLGSAGFPVAASANGLAAFNLGGVVGALICANLISRTGSRPTMLAMCAGAVAGALAIRSLAVIEPSLLVFALLAWTGGLINGTQTMMYALAAHVYPATIRATGVGTAVAFGRIGGVVSGYAGLSSGLSGLFTLLAAMMSLVLVSLALVRRHIPPTSAKVDAAPYATTASAR